jgi:mono/diheme cytochrome c family protein
MGEGVLIMARTRIATLLGLALASGLALGVAGAEPAPRPIPGLPAGTNFDLDARYRPRQILRSEAEGGKQSYMVALGNTAFSSPLLFGEKAREAGLSCDVCHRQGDINPNFHIPGISARPGGLDPTTAMFNPVQDDHVNNHVDIPSLRGARFLGPYGRDGRIGTLREFARHVIVNEFAGPEPEPRILDALVAYMSEIEFLPNGKIDSLGRLTAKADAAATRGEALFNKNFASMGGSCASCHTPNAMFADGRAHDIGSGGRFKTPTLLNAAMTAPYFHDGRFADFAGVIGFLDQNFKLGLSEAERNDLVAYLQAIGDGDDAFEPVTRQSEMSEVASYVAVLDRAIDEGDIPAIKLVVDTVNFELARIGKRFDNRNPATGRPRRPDRPDVAGLAGRLIADMSAVGALARDGQTQAAKEALVTYRSHATELVSAYPQ